MAGDCKNTSYIPFVQTSIFYQLLHMLFPCEIFPPKTDEIFPPKTDLSLELFGGCPELLESCLCILIVLGKEGQEMGPDATSKDLWSRLQGKGSVGIATVM